MGRWEKVGNRKPLGAKFGVWEDAKLPKLESLGLSFSLSAALHRQKQKFEKKKKIHLQLLT